MWIVAALADLWQDAHGEPLPRAVRCLSAANAVTALFVGIFYSFSAFGNPLKVAVQCDERSLNSVYMTGAVAAQLLQFPVTVYFNTISLHRISTFVLVSSVVMGLSWGGMALAVAKGSYAIAVVSYLGVGWNAGIYYNSFMSFKRAVDNPRWFTLNWSVLTLFFGLGGALGSLMFGQVFGADHLVHFFVFNAASISVMMFIFGCIMRWVAVTATGAPDAAALLHRSTDAPVQKFSWAPLGHLLTNSKYWCLASVAFSWSLLGAVTIADIGGMTSAVGGDPAQVELAVLLMSFGNALGRITLSTFNLLPAHWNKSFILIPVLLVMAAGCFFLLVTKSIIDTTLAGMVVAMGYGGGWTMTAPLTTLLGGPKGSILPWGCVLFFVGVAPIFGGYVIGAIYDAQFSNPAGKVCEGTACFHTSFWILGGVGLFGTIAAILFYFKTRRADTARLHFSDSAQPMEPPGNYTE